MSRLLAIVATCVAVVIAGCGEDDEAPAPAGGSSATTDAAAADERESGGGGEGRGIEVATGGSEFGEVLFDGDRRTIYLFDKESSNQSECYGACAEAWPPVLTKGEPRASGGADAELLGTTERDDGTTQVTYADHPLYYYHDEPPGQVLCHNVDEFGGLWLVVEPGGDAVQ